MTRTESSDPQAGQAGTMIGKMRRMGHSITKRWTYEDGAEDRSYRSSDALAVPFA